MIYIISQMFGLVAFVFSILAFHKDKKKNILSNMVISNILNFMQYLLLGAISGCITKVIAIIRDLVIINKKDKDNYLLYGFIIIYIISAITTYDNIYSVLPLLAAVIYLCGIWNGDELKVKRISFLTYILWLIYNICVLSIVGIISNIVSIISSFTAYKNFKKGR